MGPQFDLGGGIAVGLAALDHDFVDGGRNAAQMHGGRVLRGPGQGGRTSGLPLLNSAELGIGRQGPRGYPGLIAILDHDLDPGDFDPLVAAVGAGRCVADGFCLSHGVGVTAHRNRHPLRDVPVGGGKGQRRGVDRHVGHTVRARADRQRDRHIGRRLGSQLQRVGPRMPFGQRQTVGQRRHPRRLRIVVVIDRHDHADLSDGAARRDGDQPVAEVDVLPGGRRGGHRRREGRMTPDPASHRRARAGD